MRIELSKIVEKLGVDHMLSPYETAPWFHYDEAKGVTCSAEVRMGPGGEDMEAEIQLIKDEGDTTDSGGEGGGILAGLLPGVPKQILVMRFLPVIENKWDVQKMQVNGESYENKFDKWDEKGCDFFRACVEAMQMGELPNIEELIEKILDDDNFWGGGKRGKIGRKSPTIKPGQLLGINKPGGMKP